jgi:hypothetical protein
MTRLGPALFVVIAMLIWCGELPAQPTTSTGFGSILFPGGPPARGTGFPSVLFPGGPPGRITDTTFPGRVGSVVSGFPYRGDRRSPHGPTGRSRQGWIVGGAPIGFGLPVGTGYGYWDAAPAPPQNNITVINNLPPPVIINQTFLQEPGVRTVVAGEEVEDAGSGVTIYRTPQRSVTAAAPADGATPTVFMLAFKNHLVEPIVGYWADGERLHYITTRNEHREVALDTIDREVTGRLNKDRPVILPGPAE